LFSFYASHLKILFKEEEEEKKRRNEGGRGREDGEQEEEEEEEEGRKAGSNLVLYAQSTITVISGRDSYSDENNTLVVVFMSRITSYLSEALLKLNDLTMQWTITAERR